jgi:hypothetical protein
MGGGAGCGPDGSCVYDDGGCGYGDGCYDGGMGGYGFGDGGGPHGRGGLRARLHGFFHRHRLMRPGSMEASADGGAMAGPATSQIAFLGDEGVQVQWDVSGYGMFDSAPLVIPGRQDFYQGAIYRLKITNVPGRPGVELYPTLEVAPVTPRTDAYLAHSPIPVQFTEEDFDQVLSGNFVTKVIYLPDPEFQELALAGVETLVSTRLDPGVDPIAEADRRGSILAILRMGNKDLETNYGTEYGPEYEAGEFVPQMDVVPQSYVTPTSGTDEEQFATQAVYNEEATTDVEAIAEEVAHVDYETNSADGATADEAATPEGQVTADERMIDPNVEPAQYCGPDYGCQHAYGDGSMYGGGMYGGGGGMMPVGMATASGAPPSVPPNMIAGAPQWGMPITGTPIGLPGPPHVPLGVPAGLQKHVMKNRTRVWLPPPVTKVKLSVKQRPGMNYPRPVNRAYVDETQREPFRLLPGWLSGLFHHHRGARGAGGYGGANAYGAADCQ